MIFMASLLIFRPHLSGSGELSIASAAMAWRSASCPSEIIEPYGI